MKGAKPKPLPLKLLTMTAAKARELEKQHPAALAPMAPLVEAPEWLTEPQKREWAYVIENAPAGLLKKIDCSVVTVFVVAADLYRQASTMANQSALLVKGRRPGDVIPNPLLRLARGQALLLFKAIEQLGFSPSARTRVHSDAPAAGNTWDDISA